MPLTFEHSEGPPKRHGPGSGARGVSLFQPLIDAAYAEPGVWFQIDCEGNKNRAYSRAAALKATYGLEAVARGGIVYARLNPDEAPEAEPAQAATS